MQENVQNQVESTDPNVQLKDSQEIYEATPQSNQPAKPHNELPREWRYHRHHSKENLLSNPDEKMITRGELRRLIGNMAFVSQIESKSIDKDQQDKNWLVAMQKELNQFERNQVWKLLPRPKDHSIIGIKWIFRNKLDEHGNVVRNKARLVTQG